MQLQINQHAPVKQAKQLFIRATPEKVWKVLTDINHWTKWNEKITQAELKGKLTAGATFRWKVNGAKINSVLHTVTPNQQFGWSGTTFGGSAIHNWYLESKDNGTLIRVEESMQGWLVGLFKNKLNRDLARDMQFWLEKMKSESEQ